MSTNPSPLDARDLVDLITTTRKRLRMTWLISGTALTIVAALGWLLLAAGLDMLTPLPVPMRVLAAVVFWGLLASTIALAVAWPSIRPLRDLHVARLIEKVLPTIKNRLVSSLDLHRRVSVNGATINRSFYERLLTETRARLADFRVEQVADPRLIMRSSGIAGGVVVLAIAMAILFREPMPAAVARILRPTAPIPPVSHLRIESPGDLTALQGDPLRVEARLTRGDTDALVIRLRPDGGPWVRYPMQRTAHGSFVFDFSRLQESYTYQVEGGGTWTRAARITALKRPIIEDVRASVHLPEYMGLPDALPVAPEASQISVPAGGRVALDVGVANPTVTGRVLLYAAEGQTTTLTDEREMVWFDDRPPADAEVFQDAPWLPRPAHSGAAALQLDPAHPRFSFHTRTQQFVARRDQYFFAYLRVDPRAAPDQITIGLRFRGDKQDATWSIDPASLAPGQWIRVEHDLGLLAGKADRRDNAANRDSETIYGFWVEARGGRVAVDRIGALTRRTSEEQTTQLVDAGSVALGRDADTGRWRGEIPIEHDVLFALEFANSHGHASEAMEPMPVIALIDQPPTVLVEKPGQTITLRQSEVVPIVARALDDYGVEAVGLSFGAGGDSFGQTEWVRRFDEVQRTQLTMAAIDAAARDLSVDRPIRYRVAVRDRKGQIAFSEPYEIRLAPPDRQGDAAVDRPASATLLEGLASLLGLQDKIASLPADLLDKLSITPEGRVELPPATDLSAEQVDQLMALRELVEQQQKLLSELTKNFGEAAGQAEASPLSTDAEAAALRAMQNELTQMAERPAAMSDADFAALETMHHTLEQMDAARAALGQDAEAAQQRMMQALARMQAQQTARQLSQLGELLEQQRQNLEQLTRQVGQLQQQARQAHSAHELSQVSRQQQALDPEAIEAMRRANEMLSPWDMASLPGQTPADPMPLAPWTPPGREIEGMPVEQDTPEENPPQGPQDQAADHGPAADAPPEAENWWDQPVEAPPEAVTLRENERFASRDRPVKAPPPTEPGEQGAQGQQPQQPPTAESFQQPLTQNSNEQRSALPGSSPPQPQTPRQLLVSHQARMQQALGQTAQSMAAAQQRMGQLQQQMQAMAQSSPGSMSLSQMSEAMNSPAMAAAAAMAQAAAAQGQSNQSGQQPASAQQAAGMLSLAPSLGPDAVDVREGVLVAAELGELPPATRATLYRLPPEVRQPLIRGMTEKGPDGYQPLIDAYFRSLLDEETNAR